MSEELKPLKALESLMKDYYEMCLDTGNNDDEYQRNNLTSEYHIIETALKDYKNLKEENELLRANIENLDETYFETWRVCEELKKNSNYALMFIDNVYCLVDTKDNKFDVIDNYEINSKGIIENKKVKVLEIIKEKPIVALVDYKYTYEEWLELVDEKDRDLFKNKEEYDLLKGELK